MTLDDVWQRLGPALEQEAANWDEDDLGLVWEETEISASPASTAWTASPPLILRPASMPALVPAFSLPRRQLFSDGKFSWTKSCRISSSWRSRS
jgi:hypothetical protein